MIYRYMFCCENGGRGDGGMGLIWRLECRSEDIKEGEERGLEVWCDFVSRIPEAAGSIVLSHEANLG